ncbi:isopentenyl-diphosphate Delta-isomerase [Austwickia chelonae]|uniref:isopentenyl-diphosphate Delta-isomerase n=1 Tax=Austwickia chelonae TaxID=100225 RepID=UPI000E269174|nr:isopentenyl-diphosphate Delta-isomerase [Austwickia chelonae]
MNREETPDQVVLIGTDGRPIGTADRTTVHGTDTPLHLAFSVYLLDQDDRLLMTRRALTKRTWPGVWSNSCCGHPRPGETVPDAVARRTLEETGLNIDRLTCLLPEFTYRAVDAGGIVEHELCPVFVGQARGDLHLAPDEVMDAAWIDLPEAHTTARSAPFTLSPWCVQQLTLLDPGTMLAPLELDGPPHRDRPSPETAR